MLVKACLNGARRRTDHPGVPVTPEELAAAGRAVVAAGAGAIHMHPRGDDGAESLDGAAIDPAVAAVRAAVDVPFGVSTGAWFLPDPADRLAAIATWTERPDFASVNIHEPGALDIADALLAKGVGVEAGLWHGEAAALLVESGLAERCTRILLEPLMQDLDDALAAVADMEAALGDVAPGVPRLLHGYQATAWAVVDVAIERGYDTRIGMEDTVTLPDGSLATDNAQLVRTVVGRIR
ncbi:3-keto-5-aminohexanoate cleavage protein [Rhabdothermincola salaria]|uniref:3-keto-5-aminohexanoate cleavage protein n=1 Tax=Rhabdothermincola salaria TaxID=2903142 RepID=UPI001E5EBE30|nr:3-keto-5-aminohexanoate cleavage protein [Rhabdothermincola salaria]MCD9624088.1 3-keto-5-aminohexanoate cleavage protein [Rhabdothermincola salaria]